jgi:excisionase family DNA binding protein
MTEREILNVEEAAALLGVSVKTFNKVLHAENMPARKVGREWKFSRQALIEWVGSGRSRDFYREQGSTRGDERDWVQPVRGRGGYGGAADARDGGRASAPQRRRTAGWQIEMD